MILLLSSLMAAASEDPSLHTDFSGRESPFDTVFPAEESPSKGEDQELSALEKYQDRRLLMSALAVKNSKSAKHIPRLIASLEEILNQGRDPSKTILELYGKIGRELRIPLKIEIRDLINDKTRLLLDPERRTELMKAYRIDEVEESTTEGSVTSGSA